LRFQIANKTFETGFRAFDVNFNSFFSIQDPSVQRIGAGETIDERAEAYALDYSADSDGASAGHGVIYVIYSVIYVYLFVN
jgi:hypothetical protein